MATFPLPFPSPFGSGFSFVPPPVRSIVLGANAGALAGGLDRLIDPDTRDYVRTANGEWVETQDSRTIMLIALSIRLGRSPFDPSHGTAIGDRRDIGQLNSPEFLSAETERVGAELAAEGILSDLTVQVRDEAGNRLVDARGIQIVRCTWRDLASGSPINAIFTPR